MTYLTYQSKKCHSGSVLMSENKWLSLYGGGISRNVEIFPDLDLVLSLIGHSIVETDLIQFNDAAKKLFTSIYKIDIPEIIIDWPDMGVPTILTKSFWQWLINQLYELHKTKRKRISVLCCCIGGHGRTGTALAILGCLGGIIPQNKDPIDFVRKHYCAYAVETLPQAQYISQITGRQVDLKNFTSLKIDTYKDTWHFTKK